MFDREVYFDAVRASLFSGSLTQQQVNGQSAILDVWEWIPSKYPEIPLDLRWLSYMLATTYHETSKKMWPIEESGKGKGQPYGVKDQETGQTYFGRGFVQLTWRENYARADIELNYSGEQSCEWHADRALDPIAASRIMFRGMYEGWFRSSSDGKRQTLPRYFSKTVDSPFEAREIINGDKNVVPSWSNGMSIGKLIEQYHDRFLDALEMAQERQPEPDPVLPNGDVVLQVRPGLRVIVNDIVIDT